MCGIVLYLLKQKLVGDKLEAIETEQYEAFARIQYRGPDRSTYIKLSNPVNSYMGFHRLAMNDLSTNGDQPFITQNNNRSIYTLCNGEIYNHKQLEQEHKIIVNNKSDCAVIPELYKTDITKTLNTFNSEHAFIILDVDMKTGDYTVFISTDRLSIRPLFVGEDEYGIYIASELGGLPCLETKDAKITRFPPRSYGILDKKNGMISNITYTEYYSLLVDKPLYSNVNDILAMINKIVTDAVLIRLESDRPVGSLLSGGVDSSLVAALAAKELKKNGKQLLTFCIGLKDGTDEKPAKDVADYIGSKHTHFEVTEKDFISAVPLVIKAIGSYDITTVRASTGNYLVAGLISQSTDVKALLSGEIPDELFSGYKYNRNAPDAKALHNNAVSRLSDIHYFDVLRADRSISHWGLEARVPYADYRLIDYVLRIEPSLRMYGYKNIEKWLLREAFSKDKLIPDSVLWRPKEAFSDGVSKQERSWFTIIQEYADKLYDEKTYNEKVSKYKHLPPTSKEALYYREIFTECYGHNESVAQTIPYYWLPRWCGNITDPSARVLPSYMK